MYTFDEKIAAIQSFESGVPGAMIKKETGISLASIYRWKRICKSEGVDVLKAQSPEPLSEEAIRVIDRIRAEMEMNIALMMIWEESGW